MVVVGHYFCMRHTDNQTHIHHFLIPLDMDLSTNRAIADIQVEVDPSTLCRCTGLIEKNENLIWENDIVKHYNNPDDKESFDVGCIIWNKNLARFERTSIHKSSTVSISSDCGYEVIGNIFDNPELSDVE